jgi:hypothetical protein
MRVMRWLLVAVLAVLALALPSAGRASCGLPEGYTTFSPSRRFELVFEPREDQRPRLTIWEWRHFKRVRACRRSVVNSRSPGDLFVTDSGHVVSFDDWCRPGDEHALVVYSPTCEVIRDADLEQLVSADSLRQVDRARAARHWRYDNEPTFVTDSSVSFTSSWGMTATISVRDGTISWSGPPFKNLARLVRSDLGTLVAADFSQGTGPQFRACGWNDENVSCVRFEEGEPKEFFRTRIPRASLRGRLQPTLKLQHLIRRFRPCGGDCKEPIDFNIEFQEGARSYRYEIRGDARGPAQDVASLRALMAAFGFRTSDQK